jgi:hypothetical protein
MGALRDCEAFTSALLGQPVNTLTCVAFLVGGVVIWRRSERRMVAIGMVATGVGSMLFHGPNPPYAQLAHDITLWFLVGVVIVSIGFDLTRGGSWRGLLGPALLLGTVAIMGRLGATGNPLCNPESIWQPHGLWHIGAATAVTWWAVQQPKVKTV